MQLLLAFLLLLVCEYTTCVQIVAVSLFEARTEASIPRDRFGCCEPRILVDDPVVCAAAILPIHRGTANAFQSLQLFGFLAEPRRQERPLAKQSLMSDLDRGVRSTRSLILVADDQARVDQPLHHWLGNVRNLRPFGHAPVALPRVRIDDRQPGNE